MGKLPKASTLNNFASAWSKLCSVAVARGWTSDMVEWSKQGRLAVEREMRRFQSKWVIERQCLKNITANSLQQWQQKDWRKVMNSKGL